MDYDFGLLTRALHTVAVMSWPARGVLLLEVALWTLVAVAFVDLADIAARYVWRIFLALLARWERFGERVDERHAKREAQAARDFAIWLHSQAAKDVS